ncbi:protein ENHANCED DOWNY MILDEW 2-like [Miscanthus floridulus]|uniref:protein ENHANCED DOWNY MILDEW 2-like n=1 Tax=Miscanthus floridulus TaxID=154761 RepID=UPI003459C569
MRKDPNLSARDDTKKMGIVDDYLCAICDDGGFLICCDGKCGRLFHPNSSHGQHSSCRGLELKDDQWESKSSNFICKNCEYKKHQCFVCGKLGSSEMPPGLPEVLKCQKKYRGRFYHPNCLLKYDRSKNHRDFECPLHECHSCKNKGGTIITRKQTEKEEETYLVQCRRCPVAYHRKCLPRDISNVADDEVQRTFKIKERSQERSRERLFFYCRKHEMVGKLNSATRDHLKFPESPAVFKFDLNEKLPEETEAPEPYASTSSAPMESSASRPPFPCQHPAGYGGWLDD